MAVVSTSGKRFAPIRSVVLYAMQVLPLALMAWLGMFTLLLWLGPMPAAALSAAAPCALMGRALMTSVSVGPTVVRVRGLLKTDEIPIRSIRAIRSSRLYGGTEVPQL